MKYLLVLAMVVLAPLARAQNVNFGSLMQAAQQAASAQQGGGTPVNTSALMQQLGSMQGAVQGSAQGTAQSAVMQQAIQQLAANPQLLTQMAGSLSSTQQAGLMAQAMQIGNQIFTPQEQAKLAAFTSTPEGASIASKIPTLVQQLMPVVLQMYAAQGGVAPAAGK